MRRRLAALLVADVVGSSRLMAEDETRTVEAIRDLKAQTLAPAIAEHDGEILKHMGDGWIVAFSSTAAAVRCAMTIQTTVVRRSPLKLRIGAHIGEIVDDETDFHGAGVNIAARLQAEAPPGGLLISQDVHRQLTGPLAQAFAEVGTFELKNIVLPVTGHQWRPQLAAGGPVGPVGEVPTIVVAAFEHDPDDASTRAAARDLREQLLRRLSRRTGIRVLDAGAGEPPQPATYVLRGRCRVARTRGRLHLALVVAADDRTVWSETYEGETDDAFAFCDALVERADADLRLQINAFDGERLAGVPEDTLSVSELRALAASHFYKPTVEDWRKSRRLLDRALALNPDDPMALAMRGEAIVLLAAAHHEDLDADTALALEDDLNRAVEQLPKSDYAFWVRAEYAVFVRGDTASALRDLARTLALTPGFPLGYELRGVAHLRAGDADAAAADLERAVAASEGDPLLPYRLFMLTLAHLVAGSPEKGLAQIERAIQERPTQRNFHVLKAECARAAGDGTARAAAERRLRALPATPSILAPRPPLPPEFADLVALFAPA